MIDGFELKGMWWLPETPEKKVSGTLRFSQTEGTTLELIGSLEELKSGPIKIWETDIILGTPTKGNPITLFRCFEKTKTINAPGMITQIIYADFILSGKHFTRQDDIKFQKIFLKLSNFDNWLQKTGFTVSPGHALGKTIVEYKKPEPIELFSIDLYKASIVFGFTHPLGAHTEVKMAQQTVIVLESNKNLIHLFDWMDIFRLLQDFFTFAVFSAIYPIDIRGVTEKDDPKGDAKKEISQEVKVYYSFPQVPEKQKEVTPYDMLFTYPSILSETQRIFSRWIEKADNLKPVYDYFFSTLYAQHLYLEHKFLNLIGAIEFYHRRTRHGKYQEDAEYKDGPYKQLVDSIPEGLSSGFKASIKARMVWMNEYSQRKRLLEILREHKDILSTRINNINLFTDDVIYSRNYLIHQDPAFHDKSKHGPDLYRLAEKLVLVLAVCLLSELDIPADSIKKIISKQRRLSAA
jgi:hypothetical protein